MRSQLKTYSVKSSVVRALRCSTALRRVHDAELWATYPATTSTDNRQDRPFPIPHHGVHVLGRMSLHPFSFVSDPNPSQPDPPRRPLRTWTRCPPTKGRMGLVPGSPWITPPPPPRHIADSPASSPRSYTAAAPRRRTAAPKPLAPPRVSVLQHVRYGRSAASTHITCRFASPRPLVHRHSRCSTSLYLVHRTPTSPPPPSTSHPSPPHTTYLSSASPPSTTSLPSILPPSLA